MLNTKYKTGSSLESFFKRSGCFPSFKDGWRAKDRIRSIAGDLSESGCTPESLSVNFEKSIVQNERKKNGQYYTPKSVVKYILSQLKIRSDSTILDPSCGCGSFLLTAYDLLGEKHGKSFLRNIYGVDLNARAADITRAGLYLKTGCNEEYLDVVSHNIQIGNSIVENTRIDKNAFCWKTAFPCIFRSGGFDFVIGNPPYVTLQKNISFDPTEGIYASVIDGPTNAASLMVGKSLELLKAGGILAFLLPRSVLYVDSYSKLRTYLINNTQILQVVDLGVKFKDVRGEQVIIILRKRRPSEKQKVKIIEFSECDSFLRKRPSLFPQNIFRSTNRLLTFEDTNYYGIIEKLSKTGLSLDTIVDGKIFRGLSISGSLLKADIEEGIAAIRGKNISKFKINEILRLESRLLEKQTRNKINRLKTKKVVVQNIFSSESGVIAAYENMGLLTVDTVTNIAVRSDIQGKYILSLLNSKLINFYLAYGLFNQSRLTMHLDKSYIGLIPVIAEPNPKMKRMLIDIIESISNDGDYLDIKQKNREIDKIVYGVYGISDDEVGLIENAMTRLLSRKSAW